MVIEWGLDLCKTLLGWLLGIFGTQDPPAFINSVGSTLSDLVNSAAGLGAWIPWTLASTVSLGVFTYWLVVVGVKGVRWVWGLTPFSGGS